MRYSAASVANAFLSKAFKEKKRISPMKMQKLAYIAHGYSLVESNDPLLDEAFQAWKFGPVLNSLYHVCKYFGKDGINRYLSDSDWGVREETPAPIPEDSQALDIIDYVWKTYSNESAFSLSCWTHEKGGPWDEATNGGQNVLRYQSISNDSIKEYFQKKMYGE